MARVTGSTLVDFFRPFLIIVTFFLGLIIVQFLGSVTSSEWTLPPINPLSLAVLVICVIMLWKLYPSFKQSRKTLFLTVLLMLAYTIMIYFLGIETPERVVYNTIAMTYLSLAVSIVAIFPFCIKPFLQNRSIILFQEETAERDSVFFATSVMWLSPFYAELLILVRWYLTGNWNRLDYMVLGGAGINDVLFYYGFLALLSVCFFHLIQRLFSHFQDWFRRHSKPKTP